MQIIDVSFPAPVPTFFLTSVNARFDFHSPVGVFVHIEFLLQVGDLVVALDTYLDGDIDGDVAGVGFYRMRV